MHTLWFLFRPEVCSVQCIEVYVAKVMGGHIESRTYEQDADIRHHRGLADAFIYAMMP